MSRPSIVIDTNVFVTALCSRRGASFKLLSLVGTRQFAVQISVPLILEYEAQAKQLGVRTALSHAEIDDILDYLCRVAHHREIFFLWRPLLKDPKDDMVLELAVAAECQRIITYNRRDFVGVEQFGIRTLPPKPFLQEIGVLR